MTNGGWEIVDDVEVAKVESKPNSLDLELDHIYCGNVIDILKSFPSESIDCVITSPPYWALRDYKTDDHIWDGDPNCAHEWGMDLKFAGQVSGNKDLTTGFQNKSKIGADGQIPTDRKRPTAGNFCSKCSAWRGSLGLEPTFDLYVKHLCDIFDEIKRILKRTGTCWVNLGDTYYGGGRGRGQGIAEWSEKQRSNTGTLDMPQPNWGNELPHKCLCQIPFRFSIEMCNRGWILRNTLIWYKPNAMPQSVKDRFTSDFEYVFFFVKSKKYWFEQQYEPHLWAGRDKRSIKQVAPKSGKILTGQYAIGKVSYDKQGRHKRCVWSINTKAFAEAHFATFPETLIEPMIKAGCPEFVCTKCKKSRKRKYKVIPGSSKECPKTQSSHEARGGSGKPTGTVGKSGSGRIDGKTIEIGYTDCGCGTGFDGGVVFDPFMGSGTVAVVAKKLGRHYVGTELNSDYIDMANKRIGSVML